LAGLLGGPEQPAHLELEGHVVVELLGGLGDGGLDDGVGGVEGGVGERAGRDAGRGGFGDDVDALVGGRLGEVNGIGRGGGDALLADHGELAHDSGERGGQRLQTEVGIPEAEVEAVGHQSSF
jgi:hypothetical protein